MSNLETPQWNGSDASNQDLPLQCNPSTEGIDYESLIKEIQADWTREMQRDSTCLDIKKRPNFPLVLVIWKD